jgi:hypothetical protein
VTIADIYESKKERHINSYLAEKGLLPEARKNKVS